MPHHSALKIHNHDDFARAHCINITCHPAAVLRQQLDELNASFDLPTADQFPEHLVAAEDAVVHCQPSAFTPDYSYGSSSCHNPELPHLAIVAYMLASREVFLVLHALYGMPLDSIWLTDSAAILGANRSTPCEASAISTPGHSVIL
jgi:hypothetical protein